MLRGIVTQQAAVRNARLMSSISVQRVSGALGAEITGADLSKIGTPGFDEQWAEVYQAFLDHSVVFLRDQHLTHDQHIEVAKKFGVPDYHPIVSGLKEHPEILRITKKAGEETNFGETWHSDNSYMETPSLGSVLYGKTIPPFGNDTLFAGMYAAYEALSPGMKALLDPLKANHSASKAFAVDKVADPDRYKKEDAEMKYDVESDALRMEVEHPVVRTHPVTGRKALYVNSMFTTRFKDMTEEESAPLLAFLIEHMARPEFQCRFRWTPNAIAMWDNRCVQHLALGDVNEFDRIMERVSIGGDKPF